MTEFWLISVPGEKNPDMAFQLLSDHLSKVNGISQQWKFNIPPDLKVGTLDVLVGISDKLATLDDYAESVTKKVAQYMGDILEEQRHKLEDNLTVNGLTPTDFLTKFTWDYAKYPMKQTPSVLFLIISEQLSKIETDLKAKAMTYNTIKGSLQTLERKQTGSLLTRELGDIVKSEQFTLSSEYMTTLVVVVPRFVVRDFEYDERKIVEGKTELSKLELDKRRQFAPLFRWLKVNFGEACSALIHTKALRVFVESVLRYGLPVNFQAIIIQPNKKAHKRLRDLLHQMYHHLDSASASSILDDDLVLAGMGPVADYFPYVSFRINLNVADMR